MAADGATASSLDVPTKVWLLTPQPPLILCGRD